MRKTIISFSFALLAAVPSALAGNESPEGNAPTTNEAITLRDVADGRFSAQTISGIRPLSGSDEYARISPDRKQIVRYSFKTGRQTAVLFDADNTIGSTVKGVDDYILSPNGQKMLIGTNRRMIYRRSFIADYYIYDISSRRLTPLSQNGAQQAPVWSPDGQKVAFVRDNNIFLVKLLYDNSESQVTKDGVRGKVINGVPDWVYEEEFSFNSALAFNADGSMLCWLRFDESDVRQYSLQLYMGSHPQQKAYEEYPGEYSYKYPKAGLRNSTVTAWSFDVQSRQTRQLDVPVDSDGYIPRLFSTSDPNSMLVFTMNRHQDQLNIYTVNPASTVAKLLLRETSKQYVKEEAMEQIMLVAGNSKASGLSAQTIVLPSDRDGFMRLYLYDGNGTLRRTVSAGNADITAVYGYDPKTGDVYYQAAALNAHDRQVYVSHKNGKTERLTDKEGWNSAVFSADFKYFINIWSDRDTPYIYTTRQANGKTLATLVDNHELVERTQRYGWTKKEPFSFTTSEGVKLDGVMIKPADFDPAKKYPVIMWQYSGPGSQQVVNSWSLGSMGQGGALDMYLAQQGFIVVCVDGRGTMGRGAEFEKSVYQRLGQLEAKDQVETAIYLGTLPYVDKDNIGIWGWSFGGFCTLMSMSEGRGVFKAGVAVAPPTDWRYYDTVYTERYMRTPKENPDGYGDNPISRVGKLHGALLLCHGMADDNVHPQNTFEYAEALVQADKDFKQNYYTNRNHSIYGGNTRHHLFRQIAEWFEEHLK